MAERELAHDRHAITRLMAHRGADSFPRIHKQALHIDIAAFSDRERVPFPEHPFGAGSGGQDACPPEEQAAAIGVRASCPPLSSGTNL